MWVSIYTLKSKREVLLFIDTCLSVILRTVTGVMGRDVLQNRATPPQPLFNSVSCSSEEPMLLYPSRSVLRFHNLKGQSQCSDIAESLARNCKFGIESDKPWQFWTAMLISSKVVLGFGDTWCVV